MVTGNDSAVVATEAGLRRKLLAEGCTITETTVSLRVTCPDGDTASVPRGLVDGGYTIEQLMTIELILARRQIDLLPLDWA